METIITLSCEARGCAPSIASAIADTLWRMGIRREVRLHGLTIRILHDTCEESERLFQEMDGDAL